MKIIKNVKELGVNSKSKILAVFAHPDDEVFSSAGFLHQASLLRAETILITLTDGEASTLRFGLRKSQDLGAVRQKELFCSAEAIGVGETILGHFPDGGLNKNKAKIKSFLQDAIADLQPDFILTLEPNGIYGHADHKEVTKVLTEIHKAKKFKFKLVYLTVSPEMSTSKEWKEMMKANVMPLKPNVELKLSKKSSDVKMQAFACHKTQFRVDQGFNKKWDLRKMVKSEWLVV